MTPSARVQAAIEIVDEVIAAAKAGGAPADRLIANYFKARRYAGSKDRRAVRELVYGAIRACGPVPGSGRAAMLRLAEIDAAIAPLFDGEGHGPAPVREGEPVADGGIAPDWLVARLLASDIDHQEAAALLDRAPLDLRVNTLKAERAGLDLPEPGEPLAAPHGLRFDAGTQVEQWPAYRDGAIEVQDGGSQIVCLASGAEPGETVIDLCAGAGGKTLALAAQMENRGVLVASDTDRTRLSRLGPRAARAGVTIASTVLLDPGKELAALAEYAGKADRVLIDAPCSGTGTWRRNPEARWRLTEKRLDQLVQVQSQLLEIAKELVAPNGTITFVTCSLLDEEGAGQVERFLGANPGWRAEPLALPAGRERGEGMRLTPHHDGTDGFFVARLAQTR